MDTATLKGLLEKATKGPWHTWQDPLSKTWRIDYKMTDNSIIVGMAGRDYNANLIVALRNNAEELIASAERVARLEAALNKIVWIKECGTDVLVDGRLVNATKTERDAMYEVARQALGDTK